MYKVRIIEFTSDADRVLTDDEAADSRFVLREAAGVTVTAGRKLVLPHAPVGRAHGAEVTNDIPVSLTAGGATGDVVTLLGRGVGVPRRIVSVGGNYR